MRIGGFRKLSLIDYPKKLSAVIWTIGCNLRCIFCYNWDLVFPEKARNLKEISEEYVLTYLRERRRFLDAVVITGGEPTLHGDLPKFIYKVKQMGYLVKLDINGTNPSMLKRLLKDNLVDYVAMDIKTRLDYREYNRIVGEVLSPKLFENVKESIKVLLGSGIDYEFRTTVAKETHSLEDVLQICEYIGDARAYYLQNVKNLGKLVGGKKLTPFSDEEMNQVLNEARKIVKNVAFRR